MKATWFSITSLLLGSHLLITTHLLTGCMEGDDGAPPTQDEQDQEELEQDAQEQDAQDQQAADEVAAVQESTTRGAEKTLTDTALKDRLFLNTSMTLTQSYLAGTTNPTPDGKHAGLDYGGTWTVYSPINGDVMEFTTDCGKVVIEDARQVDSYTNKPRHIFLHMKDIKVSKGQKVSIGTVIGTSSNVVGGGCVASNAHLHYEIRKNYPGTSAVGSTSGNSTAALTYDPFTFDFPESCPSPLQAPVLSSPSNAAVNVSKSAQNFKWGAVTCATTYRVLLCTDSTCTGWSESTSACSNSSTCKSATTSSTSYAGWTLTGDKTYYWKARAGATGIGGTWTSVRSFKTQK